MAVVGSGYEWSAMWGGRKVTLASKGHFTKQRNRRGRQEGYLIGTWHEEIVVEQIFEGTTQLNRALRHLQKLLGTVWNWVKRNEAAPSCGSIRAAAMSRMSTGFWIAVIGCVAKIIRAIRQRNVTPMEGN
jgi:hypothetical protein